MTDPAGEHVPVIWRGRRVKAFVPSLLAERELTLAPETVERTATAIAEVSHSAAGMPADYAPLARMLLRAEGIASSFIEGVSAPVVDVVLAELAPGGEHTPAAWVAANLAAVDEAIASAVRPLSVDVIREWHRTLMTGSPTPERYVGAVRDEQGWIGGTSPVTAHLVTPPASYLPQLLDDLVTFANRGDIDPIAQAAICHAQFEIIHPFADGNGRVGRVLVAWILTRRLSLVTPPPVSTRIAADVGGYASGLTLFRLSRHEPWVRWFAEAVSGAGAAQNDLIAAVDQLKAAWRQRLGGPRPGRGLRSDSSAWQALDLVPRHLVLTADVVAREVGQSDKAARAALHTLASAGVLREYGTVRRQDTGRPRALYVSPELLALAGSNPLR